MARDRQRLTIGDGFNIGCGIAAWMIFMFGCLWLAWFLLASRIV